LYFCKKKSAGVANQRPSAAWDKILGGTIEFPLQKLGVMERGMGHRPGQQRSSLERPRSVTRASESGRAITGR